MTGVRQSHSPMAEVDERAECGHEERGTAFLDEDPVRAFERIGGAPAETLAEAGAVSTSDARTTPVKGVTAPVSIAAITWS